MSRFTRYISGWFGYSGRERRASIILIIILFSVTVSRFIFKPEESEMKFISPMVLPRGDSLRTWTNEKPDSISLFIFDPNISSPGELASLGLNQRQVRTIINYRNKGGKFRNPGDILKIYGMDSSLALKLSPYIRISLPAEKRKYSAYGDTSKRYHARRMTPATIDLNSCDSAQLESLPGIGTVLSARIVKYRDLLGGYTSVNQLTEVYGISDSVFEIVSQRVKVDSIVVRQIDINKATFGELIKHPYLERYDVQSIIKYRSLSGKIGSIEDLVKSKILTSEKAGRLRPYIKFINDAPE